MHERSGPVLTRRLFAAVAACALVAAACSSGGSDEDVASTTVAPTTSPAVSEAPTEGEGDDSPIDAAAADAAAVFDGEITEPDVDPTPIGVDDDILIGTLDNGLTYYVQSNDSPGSQVNLRLVVRAGSRHQEVADSGLAHFTEHMLFNGTEAYPGQELDRVLQGFGVQFGPDLNAYTSADETVYLLPLPTNDVNVVRTGIEVLREWAGRATITADAVIEERGVVREEFRLRRESPDGAILAHFADVYEENSPYENSSPLGSEEQILNTTSEDVRAFYDAWYRPEFMAVVAVGDLPAERLREMIVDEFEDLEGRGPAPTQPDPTSPVLDDELVEVFTHPEGPEPFISLDYSLPSWDPSTVGGERMRTIEEVIGLMLRNSLDEGSVRGTIPLVRPSAGPFGWNEGRRFMGFNVLASEGEAEALAGLVGELERRFVQGFTSAELQRAVDQLQGGLDQWIDSIGTVQDHELADSMVAHFLSGSEIDDPARTYERLTAALASLTPAEVSNHHRYTYDLSANLIIIVGSDPAELPTVAELEQAVADGIAAAGDSDGAAAPATEDNVNVGSIMDRPDAVPAIERNEIRSLEATRFTFENGATVIFAPSLIAEDQVFLLARGQGGWSTLAAGDAPYAALAAFAVSQSGAGDLDAVDLDRALTGSVVSMTPYIDETVEGFSGNAATDDAELMFQLLHQQIVSPRLDEAAWREAVEQGRGQARALEVDPNSAAFEELIDARYQSDPYQVLFPSEDRLDSMSADDAFELYNARLDDVDDLVIAIVGDIDVDTIAQLSERYVGSLPAGPADSWEDRRPDPPGGVVTRTVGAGANDAGAGITMLYSLPAESGDRAEATALVLQTAINTRFIEVVREELGASYGGGQVFFSFEDAPDAYLEVFVLADGDPARLSEIHRTVIDLLEDVARNGLTQDEYDRAVSVVLGDLDFVSNPELIGQLISHVERGPDDALTLRGRYQAVTGMTRDEVNDLAAEVFGPGDRIEVFRSPDAG